MSDKLAEARLDIEKLLDLTRLLRIDGDKSRKERDEARKERDEIRTRYETLVAECTRHRHATWEITHR